MLSAPSEENTKKKKLSKEKLVADPIAKEKPEIATVCRGIISYDLSYSIRMTCIKLYKS